MQHHIERKPGVSIGVALAIRSFPSLIISFRQVVAQSDANNITRVGQGSAVQKQTAKAIAARAGFDWLRVQYPSVDLSDF